MEQVIFVCRRMSLLRVLVVAACVLASTAQLTFPGESEGSSSPRDSTPSASPAADAPAGPQGQTRFLPGLLNLFDPCQSCSPSDQVEAGRCCQSGHRRCCAFLQAPGGFGPGPIPPPFGGFPGQAGGFPGQVGGFPGQVGGFPGQAGGFPGQAGGFPGQPGGPIVGPPGFGGGRPGTCPFVNNVHSGFNRFAQTTSCVAECQSDFQCPTPQKCCAVGCSSVCRNPAGFGSAPPVVIQPTTKPGFCPRPLGPLGELGSLLGLRSGAGGAGATRSLADDAGEPSGDASTLAERSDRQERRQNRKERREREKRSPQAADRDDRRERRLNRFSRNRGRVTRQAAEPDQRFFLPNPFCKDQCFNDFDCLGNLKCCIKDDCRSCTNPSFF
ncbi:collagen alpha-1(III) chain-like [Penaeus japonicus]|uniref:collagen alpha-1(III) chain-like n=1 Tax=Penaeus japonicus TaxID=27405 RepID=UPI001C70CEC5|nr:collagen alpha-1(III) chain-like [Penaeus japonicus]